MRSAINRRKELSRRRLGQQRQNIAKGRPKVATLIPVGAVKQLVYDTFGPCPRRNSTTAYDFVAVGS